nr:class I SAM-dependent methyltransferase [Actinomycetota bacterium]
VIATAYSGNADYMTDENSYPVPFTLVEIPPGCEPYPAGSRWADPDLDAAAAAMRRVVENPEEARRKAELGREDIAARYSPHRTAAFVAERLEAIRGQAGSPRALSAGRARLAAGDALESLRRRRQPQLAPEPTPDARTPVERAEAYLLHGPDNPWDAPSRLGPPGTIYRRALRKALHPYIARQRDLEAAIVTSLRDLERELGRLGRELHGFDDALHPVPYSARPELLRDTDPEGRPAIAYRGVPAAEGWYPAFEDVFRGSEAFIRDRQRSYLDLLRGHEPVLDVGCGRGELLELLRDEGIEARGIDLDPAMVERSRAKGLAVEEAEAVAHLESLKDASLGAVFSAQVVEHLDVAELVRFVELAQRKLGPGGLFVAETVNPHSFRAFKTFWVDPTHRVPLFPEVAAVLVGAAGFGFARILFPNGTGELEQDRRIQGEYAVVAVKGG